MVHREKNLLKPAMTHGELRTVDRAGAASGAQGKASTVRGPSQESLTRAGYAQV